MAKRIVLGLGILLITFIAIWAINYLAIFEFTVPVSQRSDSFVNSVQPANSSNQAPEQLDAEIPYSVEVVVQNLTVPWSIVFTDPERMIVSERTGAIREIQNGTLNPSPLFTFTDTARGGEIGLMGLAADPEYAANKYLYACVGYRTNAGFADKVVLLADQGTSLFEVRTLLDNIPAASNHAGCELAFGPDNKLYISTGDATEGDLAQDLNSLGGKILRINADGTIPADNPFPGSAIYSYGHRNPQGIDWNSQGILYEAEHGPSGNDGPGGGDEINMIKSGVNYGWPLVSHNETREGTEQPLITYTPAEAPSSLLMYDGAVFPQFYDAALVAALRGQGIIWVQFDSADPTKVTASQKLDQVSVGRVREITQGPDDYIYFTSSNTDGRGRVTTGDDKIYRLVPAGR